MGIRELIADDGFVVQFQTVGQYRAALLRELDKMNNNQLEYVTELVAAETKEEREAVNSRWVIELHKSPTPLSSIPGSLCPTFSVDTVFRRKRILPRFDEPAIGDKVWIWGWDDPTSLTYPGGMGVPRGGWFESKQDAEAFQAWLRAEAAK